MQNDDDHAGLAKPVLAIVDIRMPGGTGRRVPTRWRSGQAKHILEGERLESLEAVWQQIVQRTLRVVDNPIEHLACPFGRIADHATVARPASVVIRDVLAGEAGLRFVYCKQYPYDRPAADKEVGGGRVPK